MNHFLTATHRFFFSSDFAMGVKMALGIFLPVIILYCFDIPLPILMIAGYGSLTMSIADQTGSIKHMRNEMFGTFIAIVLITLLFIFQPEGLHFLKILSLSALYSLICFNTMSVLKPSNLNIFICFYPFFFLVSSSSS